MNYFFGFSKWKHQFMQPFLSHLNRDEIVFINPISKKNYFEEAIKKGFDTKSKVYIWGKKKFPLIEDFAYQHKLELYRIEDGFIRSVGLGSDLTQAYSVVIDKKGIYFDPTQESDLEVILNSTHFEDALIERAKKIRTYLVEKKLSKYNLYDFQNIAIPKNKKIVLVPGQVDDDASIKYGAPNMCNLKLLELARKNADDAFIIYKPHPDVLVGNREGNIEETIALKYANKVVTDVSLESVLSICDEVHTMTSLVGFEALIRNKKVFTYGMPFYAGWGLTIDMIEEKRRKRELKLDELVAGTLLLYPMYINPTTLKVCEIEIFLDELEKERELYKFSYIYRVKLRFFNYISRKSQLFLRIITPNI